MYELFGHVGEDLASRMCVEVDELLDCGHEERLTSKVSLMIAVIVRNYGSTLGRAIDVATLKSE